MTNGTRGVAISRFLAVLLVVVAAGAFAGITLGRTTGSTASSAYYEYCPNGSAPAVYYGYCPPPNEAPDCSTVVADPAVLWAPDHKLRLVQLSGGTDPDGDALTLTITGVTQDEPVNAAADGNTAPDAQAGPTPSSVFVRAERSGAGDGRVYRIAFTLSDGNGGTCSGVVEVGVPHDQGQKATAVDSRPPSFDSFSS